MEYKVQTPQPWKRVLEVSLPGSEVTQEIDRLSGYYSKKTKLDGFRAGKVPSRLVKAKHFTKLQEEAIEKVVQEAYGEALQESNLSPITHADISNVSFDPGGRLSFKASFEVIPEVEIRQYKNLRSVRKVRPISNKHVDRELDRLRKSVPVLKPVERRVRENDAVVVDLETYQGRKLVGKTAESTMLVKDMAEEVQKKLVGRRAGDIVNLDDHRKVTYITIKEVKEPLYSELNDDFAKDLGFEDLKSLKGKIRKELKKAEDLRSEREVEDRLIRLLMEKNPFEPPSSLVELQLDQISTRPEERENYRSRAVYLVKREIILDKIAPLENISVNEGELEEEIHKIAKSKDVSPERLKMQLEKSGRMAVLKNQMRYDKVLKFLVSEASIETEKVKE